MQPFHEFGQRRLARDDQGNFGDLEAAFLDEQRRPGFGATFTVVGGKGITAEQVLNHDPVGSFLDIFFV